MKQYQQMLQHILDNGEVKNDRTGTGTISTFGYQTRYNLEEGFPLLTTKKVSLRIIFEELKWFLSGDTNIKYLVDNNVNIWNGDAYRWYKQHNPESQYTMKEYIDLIKTDELFAKKHGNLGRVYGFQWSNFGGDETRKGIDQIKEVFKLIEDDPDSRRMIVSGWNPYDQSKMALPPCHSLFQFYVSNDNKLSCQLYQRSCDAFLGGGFNVASYSMLVHMIAHLLDLKVGEFIHTIGDNHIYSNHVNQVKEQLSREPKKLPQLNIVNKNVKDIRDFTWEDFELVGYDHHPQIKASVSVGL